ncbi:MAG: T9SS type A sorting domain-containing protein [Bacteroidales bacterium]|jgi:hypothetical protein|nr:T9SS type A sorting domain-containing protein [Bacteroidales bacterium]
MKNLILLPIVLFAFFQSAAQFAGGDGSSSNPFQVSTPEQLSEVRNYLTSHFIQINDINLKNYDHDNDGKAWMPIAGAGTGQQFRGHYDGQDFIIYNLTINRPGIANVGLFGHIGISDDVTPIEIVNVGLISVDIDGGRGVGALVGRVTANSLTKIEYSFVRYGTVIGDGAVGGLVGSNNSYRETANSDGYKPLISKSFANVDVYWSERTTGDKFGGLAGCTQKGRIINSYARGSVNVDNTTAKLSSIERVGGLVGCGLQRGEILYSYSSTFVNVPVSNPSVTNVGGLTGTSDGNTTITSSFWDLQTSGWATSPSGVGETTVNMNKQSTFIDYDFTSIWGIDPAINEGYPYLRDGSGGILPVELIHFSAKEAQDAIKLEWITASEKNNDFFALERSFDGIDFTTIDIIPGNGNSNTTINYDFLDKSPVNGMNYYRLKQTDFDGKFEYSEVIYSEFNSKPTINIFPNPAKTYVQLEIEGMAAISYKIIDLNGRTLLSDNIYDTHQRINLENIPAGSYQGIIYPEAGKPQYFKLIKTN